MKANSKRKVFGDAVDLLMGDIEEVTMPRGVEMVPVKSIQLLTMCESRTTLCKVLTEEVTGSFQGKIKVFDTRIPTTVKVGESIYYNLPIAQYSKKASAGIAYRKFAKEIIAYEG